MTIYVLMIVCTTVGCPEQPYYTSDTTSGALSLSLESCREKGKWIATDAHLRHPDRDYGFSCKLSEYKPKELDR